MSVRYGPFPPARMQLLRGALSIDFPGYWRRAGVEKPSQFRRRAERRGLAPNAWRRYWAVMTSNV